MDDYLKEKRAQRRREYYRKWRAEHRDSVQASQMRYWTKKAAEMRSVSINAGEQEERHDG